MSNRIDEFERRLASLEATLANIVAKNIPLSLETTSPGAFNPALAPKSQEILFDRELESATLYSREERSDGIGFRWVGPLPAVMLTTNVPRVSPVTVAVYVVTALAPENITNMTILFDGDFAATTTEEWELGGVVVRATFSPVAGAEHNPVGIIEIKVPHASRPPSSNDERVLAVAIHKVTVDAL